MLEKHLSSRKVESLSLYKPTTQYEFSGKMQDNFTAFLSSSASPSCLPAPSHFFLMQLQWWYFIYGTMWKECEVEFSQRLWAAWIHRKYSFGLIFKSFRLKEQFAKFIYSPISILCSTVYRTFFSTPLFLFLLFI